ncbi:DUF6602 domain-containing protein [Acinetobacter gyllenbergii]|uniref:DUF6602 domain-containing protein n=1 Tax=Acinetobacter gyllenbergii TaxID=134534 RepID=UPI0008069063|nr:DUF6602 domain-containing protein [Acinetobacter gyllenbergii]OBY75271.1 hypothetical protein NG55_00915 [Acinetobacter gyllenbergii]
MSIISEKFNAKVNALKADFKLNKDVIHQGVKGGLNESELSSLISEIIPKKYKISKGVIENSRGEQSNETDFFIYDDEILPPYIKNELAFVPVEAVKYVFEVKSTLNSTELKTTIGKFKKYADMGGNAPTILFAFSSDIQGTELTRYKKNDEKFYTYPSVMSLCISNKSYYFKHIETKYLKEYLTKEEFLRQASREGNLRLNIGGANFFVESNNFHFKSEENKLTVNGIDYAKITFNIHKWIGIEHSDNTIELSLLSGISNTLCKEKFGLYLLENHNPDIKIFSVCYEDMWGNLSCQDFNENGLDYNPDNVSFKFSTSSENHKIIFKPMRKKVD